MSFSKELLRSSAELISALLEPCNTRISLVRLMFLLICSKALRSSFRVSEMVDRSSSCSDLDDIVLFLSMWSESQLSWIFAEFLAAPEIPALKLW